MLRQTRKPVSLESLETRDLMAASLIGPTLKIDGTATNDVATVSQVTYQGAAKVQVVLNGVTTRYNPTSVKAITFYGYDGNDRLTSSIGVTTVARGGNGNDTMTTGAGNDRLFGGDGQDTLYGGAGDDHLMGIDGWSYSSILGTGDTLHGGAGRDSFWGDENGVFGYNWRDRILDLAANEVNNQHFVSQFENGADRSMDSDAIDDPTDGMNYRSYSAQPLFGAAGPTERDIRQGGLLDCWLLSGLGSMAKANSNSIRQTVADMGDGTYAVQLGGNFYRVDADLPTDGNGNLTAAKLGEQGSIWTAIAEKAYTYYRPQGQGGNADVPQGTYANLNWGQAQHAMAAIRAAGANRSNFADYTNGQAILNDAANKLAQGKAVGMLIVNPVSTAPLAKSHEYMVVRVNKDAAGKPTSVVLRNPWGTDGKGSDGNNDGLVTVSVAQIWATTGYLSWGQPVA